MRTAGNMIIVQNDMILGVSRKDNHASFGLPGGKSEFGETPKQTAIRETYEETGILVSDCVEVYAAIDQPFLIRCYLALTWEGTPTSKEDGKVKWIQTNDLTCSTSAFPVYNTNAIAALKDKYPNLQLK